MKTFFRRKIVNFIVIGLSAILLALVGWDCAQFFVDAKEAYRAHIATLQLDEAPFSDAYLDQQFYTSETLVVDKDLMFLSSDESASALVIYQWGDGLPTYKIRVNRALNCVTIYGRDETGDYTVPVRAICCSTGKNNRTPLGTFKLGTKYRWRKMLGGVYSQYAFRVYGGVLIHSVPYYTQNPGNLETYQYNRLGQQASAGCIRMSVEDAKWVFDHCEEGTLVEIYDDAEDPGPLGKPDPIEIDTSSPYAGWDPTDPDENNPWNLTEAEES